LQGFAALSVKWGLEGHIHPRECCPPAYLTGGEGSHISSPQQLTCFFLIQPVNLEADLFSSNFNGFETEPNHGELILNAPGLWHIPFCVLGLVYYF